MVSWMALWRKHEATIFMYCSNRLEPKVFIRKRLSLSSDSDVVWWFCGVMVLWCGGFVVWWFCGVVVLWCGGFVV